MTEPKIINEVRGEAEYSAVYEFDPAAEYFKGHFPDGAILAGVVQTGIAVKSIERFLGTTIAVREIKKLKFSRVIRPGEQIDFKLVRKADGEFAFSYQKEGSACSSGIICF